MLSMTFVGKYWILVFQFSSEFGVFCYTPEK
jgi:hypothetical protein